MICNRIGYVKIGCMTSPIKAIIFDFGNVLLEWDPRNVYQRFFPDDPEGMEHFLKEVNFMEWNLQQDKGRHFSKALRSFRTISSPFRPHSGLSRSLDQFSW